MARRLDRLRTGPCHTRAMARETHSIGRLDAIDALRGLAVLWMTVFHFSFDLSHLGIWRQNFLSDPFWTVQRTAIVSLFLVTAGMSQTLAVERGQDWPRFWRRWCQVAGCAVLVSLGSWLVFPRSFIYFGVLHGLALMLPLARAASARRVPASVLLAGGAACIALHHAWMALVPGYLPTAWLAALDSRWLNPLGLITRKPFTEDYVPVLPWLGVVFWGCALGRWLPAMRLGHLGGTRSAMGAGEPPPVLRALAWIGGWSLSWYMLHQPVLIGALLVFRGLSGGH